MPMPHGTYIHVKSQIKISNRAKQSKSEVNQSRKENFEDFYEAINEIAEADLDAWHRSMATLVDDIKQDAGLSKDAKVRKKVSKVLEQVRKVVEKARDYKQLEGRLQLPVYDVVQTPKDLGTAGAELALVIALCQMLEGFVRIRRSKR